MADWPVDWDERGAPRSRLFGDVYFSADDGLAESRAVFLTGCGLPEAWAGRERFTVGELGFGTGLNIIALLDCWRATAPPTARLNVFSVEAHLMSPVEARRALAAWPELGPIAEPLLARWPPRVRGVHRIDLPDLGATIDLALMDVERALTGWIGEADAWFLDGFSPAVNPEMWSAEVIDLVAARAAPGARVATYTVAGEVRRGLASASFAVERKAGFGRKRERLEARWPGARGPSSPAPSVAIIGAGIAGAALARAFRALGAAPEIFDMGGAGAGASGGPAALVSPRLDAGLGPAAALFAQAMSRAGDLYRVTPGVARGAGAVQVETQPKDASRFKTIAGSDLFAPKSMTQLRAGEMRDRLGEPAPGGLALAEAMTLEPAAVLSAWLGAVTPARIATLQRREGGWRLMGEDGGELGSADIVCVAAGMDSLDLVPAAARGWTMTPVRGQSSFAKDVDWPGATLFGAYAMPVRGGVLFGATHDRGDTGVDARAADEAHNLAAVTTRFPGLGARLSKAQRTPWVAVRATTRDYLPIAGAARAGPDGLFILSGLGSRGFCLGPLLGEHVAALALGAPSPLPRDLAALVDPARFEQRAHRRGQISRSKSLHAPIHPCNR